MRKRKKREGIRAVFARLTDPIYDVKRSARVRAAAIWRRQNRSTTFIAITGSHGKSTATALLGKILSAAAPTKTGPLHNVEKFVAQTVLGVAPWKHRYCVAEVSGFPLQNIDKAFRILQPQVAIVTAIGGDHRAAFRSFDSAAAEKSKLVHKLSKDGLAVLNADDPLVAAMAAGCVCRVATFGSSETADLRLIDGTSVWPDRLTIKVAYHGEEFTVKTRLVGTQWHVSVLAALLAALELGVPRDTCLAAIEAFEPVYSKMSVHPAPQGAWYVMDADKLSYYGMEACLSFLKGAEAPRRTVFLGTISDHPGSDRPHYQNVARLALSVADRVIFTGNNAMAPRRLKEEFADRLILIENRQQAAAMVIDSLLPGEIVYIKGPSGDGLKYLFMPDRKS